MSADFTGIVSSKADRILWDDAADVRAFLVETAGERVRVRITREGKRSLRANRYYWGVVVPYLAEHFGYDKQEMHEVLAMRFLRVADDPRFPGFPRRQSTAAMNNDEFSEYVSHCIRLAAEHGVVVPAPGEL